VKNEMMQDSEGKEVKVHDIVEIFVIKYALTMGIQKITAEYLGNDTMKEGTKERGHIFYYGVNKNWCFTFEDAHREAKLMRDKRVESMKKKIKVLKNMTFDEA